MKLKLKVDAMGHRMNRCSVLVFVTLAPIFDIRAEAKDFAVDATLDYHEIDKGLLKAGLHTIHLKRTSDWALAVGESGERTSGYAGHPEEERR